MSTTNFTIVSVAIVEVERLWYRFQQLGCNEDGVLKSDVLTKPPASTDVFAKNVSSHFVI